LAFGLGVGTEGDAFGDYDCLADLFPRIGFDERLHKIESELPMRQPRFR
jgi:hypothetical protein